MVSDLVLAEYCAKSYGGLTLKAGTTELLVARRGSAKVVAFRGTDDKRDVMTNLSFIPSYSRSCGLTHGGYLRAVRGVIFDLMSRINKDDHLYLTGHSKGGAEALICARMLEVAGYNVVKVLTIGAPKICCCGVGQYDTLMINQYANKNDPVDNLPLMPWWRHPRKVQKINAAGHSLKASLLAMT